MKDAKSRINQPITYPAFAVGQQVTNQYGQRLTVTQQRGCQVWVREHAGHYHPTKLKGA